MIKGLGIDLVETGRIARALSRHGKRFEERVFTQLELSQCADRPDRVQALAARFAAKEACLKALGTGWAEGLAFRQIEIVRAVSGRPEMRLGGAAKALALSMNVENVHLSMTHQPGTAAATVILEG